VGILVPGPEGRWKSAATSTMTICVIVVVALILAVVGALYLSGTI
jgi:hypothetical protein